MVMGDLHRFHNSDFRPSSRTYGAPGGIDRLGFDRCLAPQPYLLPSAKCGRKSSHLAPGAIDHLVCDGNQLTYRTTKDVYRNLARAELDSSLSPYSGNCDTNEPEPAAAPDQCSSTQSPAYSPEPKYTSECAPVFSPDRESVATRPDEALHSLRLALGKRGMHGALEFAQLLRAVSTSTSSGTILGFTDLARVISRFAALPDSYIHSIFRTLDKDCFGCVRLANVIDIVFVQLSPVQLRQVKILFATIHDALRGDMDIRQVLQLENFKNHADHLSGLKSKATLLGEFADCIAADSVTWISFRQYYRALATATVTDNTSLRHSILDIWRVQYPADEAAAEHRAHAITEPAPPTRGRPGALKRFPVRTHIGMSPIFNPATFEQPPSKRVGKLCEYEGKRTSSVRFG